MKGMRARSLFTRLLMAQVLLAVVLTVVLAALFYAERNRTVAQLVASRWSPVLKLAAQGAPIETLQRLAPGPLLASPTRPERVFQIAAMTPRLGMVREALQDEGLPLADLLFGRDDRAQAQKTPTLWLALRLPEGAIRWIGFESDLVEARLRERVVVAVVLLFALAVAASAWIAHRLAQPLEALRARIAQDDAAAAPLPHASVEVQAIDEAWRALRAHLAQQERERALLLAGVSHDLRSPLGRIRMAAELLPDAPGVAPRREAIVRNAALADRLLGSFLDHVRSGELPLNQTVDLAALARSVAAPLQRSANELRIEAPSSLVVAQANAVLIERMMINLLDNAFTHGQAPVVLRVSAAESQARIEVEDQGPGIAPEQQTVLLQAFARGDASRSRPGLGLGLAVVHRVALRLGGVVSFVATTDQRGPAVRVQWPAPQ
jgi:two-component system, OmpR family, osmolarity sensor histidine kinase EnvZ